MVDKSACEAKLRKSWEMVASKVPGSFAGIPARKLIMSQADLSVLLLNFLRNDLFSVA